MGGTTTPNGGRCGSVRRARSPAAQGVELGWPAAHAGPHGHRRRHRHRQASRPERALHATIEADGAASLSRVDEWKGAGNYAVSDAIKAMRPADDRYSTITNGPAGEAGMKAAGIAVSDMKGYPNRFAGRGGLGAVMGSKGLKAIVISDKGLGYLEHADKEAFNAAMKRFSSALKEHPVSGQGLPTYGTNVLTNILSEAGGLPTRNFSEARSRVPRRPVASASVRSRSSAAVT